MAAMNVRKSPQVVHQRTAVVFLRHPVSAKIGEISSNGRRRREGALRASAIAIAL
jgi:hypothetical protein